MVGPSLEPSTLKSIASDTDGPPRATAELEAATQADDFATTAGHIQVAATTLHERMDAVRGFVDALGSSIADECWPLPKYRELLVVE